MSWVDSWEVALAVADVTLKGRLIMKRLKVLGLFIMAVSMLSATVAASSASAAMKNAEFTVASTGTSTSGPGTLFGPANITCLDDKDTTTATNKKEGTISIDFLDCSLLGEECHSLGDKTGTILTGGKYLLVLLDINGKDQLGILITIEPLHIECKFLSTLVSVTGSVLGLIESKEKSKSKFLITIKAKGAKEQEVKEYLNEEEKAVKAGLKSSTDEGTAEESGEEAGEDILTTEKETELIN